MLARFCLPLALASSLLAGCGDGHPLPPNAEALAGKYIDPTDNMTIRLEPAGRYFRDVWNGDAPVEEEGIWSSKDGVTITLSPKGRAIPNPDGPIVQLTVVSNDELRAGDGHHVFTRQ